MAKNARKHLNEEVDIIMSLRITKKQYKYLKKVRLISGLNSSDFIRRLIDISMSQDEYKEEFSYEDF